MKLLCSVCHRDLNSIGHDNMSDSIGTVLCEDCSGFTARKQREYAAECEAEYAAYLEEQEKQLEEELDALDVMREACHV